MQRRNSTSLLIALLIAGSGGLAVNASAESDLDYLLNRIRYAETPKVGDPPRQDRSTFLVSDVDENTLPSRSDVDVAAPLAAAPATPPAPSTEPPITASPPREFHADDVHRALPLAAACDCAQHGCRHGCAAGAASDPGYVCQPHVTPNLPSSTLRQYFRGNPCHAHLWDGYAQERQQYCEKYHKHIHGRCECGHRGQCEPCVVGRRSLKSSLGRAIGHRACRNDTSGCDADHH
ncbi:MAG: hypothetical protein ACF788_10925 [Novipirellula sp. JB048]